MKPRVKIEYFQDKRLYISDMLIVNVKAIDSFGISFYISEGMECPKFLRHKVSEQLLSSVLKRVGDYNIQLDYK